MTTETENLGEQLVFLISQPRSGSTLLQLILAGHADVATCSEPWIALHPAYALRREGMWAEYGSGLARDALGAFLAGYGADEEYYFALVRRFLLSLYALPLEESGKRLFLDKTPRYYHIIPELKAIFPAAKFIILKREPAAVLHSMIRTWCEADIRRLHDYKEDLLDGPQKLAAGLELLGDSALEVRYERLIDNPADVIRGICDFLGIAFDPSLLALDTELCAGWEFGDRVGVFKHSRVSGSGAEAWKKSMKDPQFRHLAASYLQALGPTAVERLGYNYDSAGFEAAPESGDAEIIRWSEIMGP